MHIVSGCVLLAMLCVTVAMQECTAAAAAAATAAAAAAAAAERAENDGKMAAKSIRFLNFSASGGAGVHLGRPAGARRL